MFFKWLKPKRPVYLSVENIDTGLPMLLAETSIIRIEPSHKLSNYPRIFLSDGSNLVLSNHIEDLLAALSSVGRIVYKRPDNVD